MLKGYGEALRYPRTIILEDMPNIQSVTLPWAFMCKKSVTRRNIGILADHPRLKDSEY